MTGRGSGAGKLDNQPNERGTTRGGEVMRYRGTERGRGEGVGRSGVEGTGRQHAAAQLERCQQTRGRGVKMTTERQPWWWQRRR